MRYAGLRLWYGMKRGLLNALTVASILLCIPVVVIWVRSYFKEDAVQVSKQAMTGLWYSEETWQAWSGRGGLSLCWSDQGGDLQTQQNADDVRGRTHCDGLWHYHFVQWNWGPMYGDGSFSRAGRRTYLGFGVDRHDSTNTGRPAGFQKFWMAVVPWPAIAAPFAAVPAIRGFRAWRRRLRERRRRVGRCLNCGYDLRASPGRCPECGTPSLSPLL